MDSNRHQKIKEVFLAVVEQPRERWSSVLKEHTAGDDDLRHEVQLLLDFHVGVDGSAPRLGESDGKADKVDKPGEPAKPLAPDERPTVDEMAPTAGDLRAPDMSGLKPTGGTQPSKLGTGSAADFEHGRFLPGTVIAHRYRIVALIGKGGMGEVYRADDLKLGQAVALKFLPATLAANPKRLEQFVNEVRIARQVSHHNVCRVYDIGEHGDEHFISMEYVDGETLDSLISRIGRIPERKAIQLAQELCAALSAIHERGMLHRDLKPANIMIDGRGQLRLTDFGLASARELHGFEAASGTPGFVAPESLAGREATVSSDIYTLGLVLYELFTGVSAYKPGPARTVLKAQETTDPPSPITQAPDLSPEVEHAIQMCLAREPSERPKSVRDVAAMLPGGDPLAAALAAGVTPSPELVAASGAHGRMSILAACFWLFSFIGLLIIGRVIQNHIGLLAYAPLPKSPEVLADKAEVIIDRLGYTTPAVDRAYELDLYEEFIGELEKNDTSSSRWERLRRTRPSPIDFWYRRSPVPMYTMNPLGWFSWEDPPNSTPGMISLRLTPTGLLRELVVVDEHLFWSVKPSTAMEITVRPDAKPTEPNWRALFEAAGLDINKFQPVDPVRIPVVFSDIRAAWVGVYPEFPDEQVRVEASGLHGKPVSFRTVEVNWPLSQNIGAVELGADHPNTRLFYEIGFGLTIAVAGIAALILAQRNLRYKRADRHGALRVGYALFVIILATMLLNADTWVSFSPWYSPVGYAFAMAVAVAVGFGISYMAIEPYIRRVWPETIVGWARLLAGQFLDPLVGQSLLVGATLGVLGVVVLGLRHYLTVAAGHPPPEPMFDYDYGVEPLGPARQAIGMLLQIVVMALFFSVVFAFIQLLLRLALRRTDAAIVIGGVIQGTLWTFKFHSTPWATPEVWALFAIGGAACGIVLVRFGVLALATGAYVYYLLKIFPPGLSGVWYANVSVVALLLACVIALAGASVGLFGSGRRRVFGLAPSPTRATV